MRVCPVSQARGPESCRQTNRGSPISPLGVSVSLKTSTEFHLSRHQLKVLNKRDTCMQILAFVGEFGLATRVFPHFCIIVLMMCFDTAALQQKWDSHLLQRPVSLPTTTTSSASSFPSCQCWVRVGVTNHPSAVRQM